MNLITEGCTNKDIAKTFGISEETVKRHLTNIFNKLGVGNRLELALFALNHSLAAQSKKASRAAPPADAARELW